MANFKRKRPKNARPGYLMCKWHKANGVNARPHTERRAALRQHDDV